jgi:hypothetical protein
LFHSAEKWRRHRDAYSSENEARGMDVHLGIEGTNSNGHGEEIDKDVSMMKIIKNLQKDVQIHQAMRSLERIKKKLYKESGSSKSGSHGTPEKKGRSRSGSRHHQHSQKHSHRRANSSSSPSPIRKHRRSGVDELKGEMNKIKPPTFDGEHKKDDVRSLSK